MTKDWNQPDDAFILVGGPAPEAWRRAARPRCEEFPVAKAQTLAQFKDTQADSRPAARLVYTRCCRCR
jgi:hypothetical protein